MKRFRNSLFFASAVFLLVISMGFVSSQTCDSDQVIFKIQGVEHGEVWNGAGGYTDEICYDTIFGDSWGGSNPHDCTSGEENLILRLSSSTNAHGEIPNFIGSPTYSTDVCYGNLNCVSQQFFTSDVPHNLACVIGSFVAGLVRCKDTDGDGVTENGTDCHITGYIEDAGNYALDGDFTNYLICCDSTGIETPIWINGAGEPVNLNGDVDLNDTVWMKSQTQGFIDGTEIEFEVDGKDGLFFVDVGDYYTDVFSGEAIYPLVLNQTIVDILGGCSTSITLKVRASSQGQQQTGWSNELTVDCLEDNSHPVANITGPVHGQVYYAGGDIDFTHNSYDTDGFLEYYVWEFNDGGTPKKYCSDTSEEGCDGYTDTEGNFAYNYDNSGLSTITLTVRDNFGLGSSDQIAILVINSPGIFAWINYPGFEQIVPYYEQGGGVGDVEVEAIESYVVKDNGITSCSSNLTCVGGTCPAHTYSPHPSYSCNISITQNAGGGFSGTTFDWYFNGEGPYGGEEVNSLINNFGLNSEALNDKNILLKVMYGSMVENASRKFTLGHCINAGETFLNTDTGGYLQNEIDFVDVESWDCVGNDGIGGTPDDCCPAYGDYDCADGAGGWKCRDDGPGASIDSCEDYTNEVTCEADCDPTNEDSIDCVGEGSEEIGVQCSPNGGQSWCSWVDLGGTSECITIIQCETPNGVIAECEYGASNAGGGNCISGFKTVEYQLLPCTQVDGDGNPVVYEDGDYDGDGIIDNGGDWCTLFYEDVCGTSGSYTAQVPCGRLDFELKFFENNQIISAIIFMILLYYLLRFIKKKEN